MESLHRVLALIYYLNILIIKDVSSFTVSASSGTAFGLLGRNQVELACAYSPATGDTIFSLEWQRKKPSPSNDYETFAKFYPPSDNQQDASINTAAAEGAAVNGRVNLTNPTSTSLTAKVLFTEIVCADEREYQCKVTGDTNTGIMSKVVTKNLVVRAKPLAPSVLVVEPKSSVEEGGSLKFTCSGDVGRPEGKFKWSKFIGSTESPISPAQTTATQKPDDCTFKAVSTITLKMSRDDNQASIRCTVGSHVTLPTSETNKLYKMTDKITVYYPASTPRITKIPNQEIYYAGENTVILPCVSDGNPKPSYKWLAPNGNQVSSSDKLVFNSMSVDQSGSYTCVSENSYNSKTFNVTSSVEINIDDVERFRTDNGQPNSASIVLISIAAVVLVLCCVYAGWNTITRLRRKQNGSQDYPINLQNKLRKEEQFGQRSVNADANAYENVHGEAPNNLRGREDTNHASVENDELSSLRTKQNLLESAMPVLESLSKLESKMS